MPIDPLVAFVLVVLLLIAAIYAMPRPINPWLPYRDRVLVVVVVLVLLLVLLLLGGRVRL
jgi:fumarate reductase subunit C